MHIKKEKLFSLIKNNKSSMLIVLIAIFSFFLNIYSIKSYGYGNEYYAASVLSMTKSFKNFFFGAFDPSGILSIDKSPLGLWIQVAFVSILGFKGYALILPQAICGTLSCILIYIIVKRYLGNINIAILSSLFFAMTPIIVVTSRNNTMDMQLVFICLLSSLFFLEFINTQKLKYLIISSFLIGIGFNIKMMQVFLIIPSIVIVYYFCKISKKKKIYYLLICSVVTLVISSIWPLAVYLTPSSERPYIDSTSNNSVIELITGHNGAFRILGKETIDDLEIDSAADYENYSVDTLQYTDYIGKPSITRLFNKSIYGQSSWLIIFTFLFIIILAHSFKKINYTKKSFYIFFVSWFVSMFIFFSFAGFYHRYYLCMIVPSICILAACGINKSLQYYKNQKKYILYVPFALTMILDIVYLMNFKNLSPIFTLSVLSSSIIIFMMMVLLKKHNKLIQSLTIICLLLAPFYWCLTTLIYVPNLTKPSAGAEIANGNNDIYDIDGGATTLKTNLDLKKYLIDNYKNGSFFIASSKASDIANLMIYTDLPALCCNGFTGGIDYISIDDFKKYISEGKIRYFVIFNDKNNQDTEITNYVKENGTLIKEDEYNHLPTLNNSNKNKPQKKYNFSLYYFNN